MNTKRLVLLSVLTIVLLMVLSVASFAQTYVNNTNGDDLVGTGTAVNPYKTIAVAITNTASGGTISIAADTYGEAAITVTKPLTFVATTFNALSTVTITNGLTINTTNATDVVSLGETGEKFNLGTTAGALVLTKGVLNISGANVIVGSGGTITRTAGTINNTPTVTNANVVYNGTVDITAGPELAASIGTGSLNVNITAGKTITVPSALTTTGGISITTGNASFTSNLTLTTSSFTNTPASNTVTVGGTMGFTSGRLINVSTGAVTVNGNVTWTMNGNVTDNIDNMGNGNITLNGTVTFAKFTGTGEVAANHTASIRNNGTGTLTLALGFTRVAGTISSTAYTPTVDLNNASTGTLAFGGSITALGLTNVGTTTLTGGTISGVVANNSATSKIELFASTTFSNATIGNGNAAAIIKLNANTLTISSATAAVTNTGKIISTTAATIGAGVVAITGATATITGGEIPNMTIAATKGVTLAGGVNAYGDITSAGALILTGNLTLFGSYAQNVGGTLGIAANTFDVKGNWIRVSNVPGDVTYTTGILQFTGSAAQTFTSGASLTLYDLVVNKTSATILTVTQTLTVANNFTITSGTVALGDNHVRMTGAGGVFTNTGGYTSSGNGYIIFDVAGAQTITGTGLFSNIDVRSGVTLTATSAINFSGNLILRQGTLLIGTNTFTYKNDLVAVPSVTRYNLGTMTAVGGTIAVATGVVYDLTYAGSGNITAAAEWKTGTGMRNLTIATGDATTPQTVTGGGAATTISGALTVNQNQTLDLNTFNLTLSGANQVHTVVGKVVDNAGAGTDALVFTGDGSSLVGSTIATATAFAEVPTVNVTITAAQSFTSTNIKVFRGNFTVANGTVNVTMNSAATPTVIGDVTLTAGTLNFTAAGAGSNHTGNIVLTAGSLTYTRSTAAAADYTLTGNVTLTAGTFTLGTNLKVTGVTSMVDANVVAAGNHFTSVGAFTRSGSGAWSATTGKVIVAAAGAVNFDPGATAFTIPNFEIANGTTNVVTLVNSFTVSNAYTQTSGTLALGGNDLTLSGNTFTFTAGAYTAAAGAIKLTGSGPTVTAAVAPTFVNLTLNSAGVVTFTTSVSPAVALTFTVSGAFVQTAGDVTLGIHSLAITGSFTRVAGAWSMTTGYLVFNTGTAFAQGSGFTVDNLSIDQSISGTIGTVFTVNKNLLLKANAVLTMTTLKLTLADGCVVERQNDGAKLSSVPTFGGAVSVKYTTTAGISTVANFNELPTTVKDFTIVTPATVTLPKNITVTGTLTLGDVLTTVVTTKNVTMADGSTLVLKGTGSTVLPGTNLVRAGAMSIEYDGAAITSTRELGAITSGAHPAVTGNVTIKSAIELDANVTFAGSLTFDGGNIDQQDNTTGGGPFGRTVDVQGDVIQTSNGGFFIPAGAGVAGRTVNFSGANNTALTLNSSISIDANINMYIKKTNATNTVTLGGGNLDFATNSVKLYFVNGVLVTGNNIVILKQSSAGGQPIQGFDRAGVTGTNKSHIFGNVKKFVDKTDAIAIARVEFPTGTQNPNYRPFAIYFKNTPQASVNITVSHASVRPGGSNGFPIRDGGLVITNYPDFYWYVKSDISLAPSYLFDMEAQAEGYADYSTDGIQNLRFVRRDSGLVTNQWVMQKNNNTGTVLYDNSTIALNWPAVKVVDATGGITLQGSIFTYSQINKAPTFTVAPGNLTKNEGDTLSATFTAFDPDLGDLSTMSSVTLPTGATFNATTGVVSWVIPYTLATKTTPTATATITIRATDTYGPLSKDSTVTITINNVNRKPDFAGTGAAKLAATTIVDGQALAFTYVASDVDADAVTYVGVGLPTGATVSTAGVLAWTPTFAQAGASYTITVVANDGALTDTTSAVVTVNRSIALGDVDKNGTVQAADASVVLQHVVGLTTITDAAALWAADASANGTISAFDAGKILQAAAGLITLRVDADVTLGKIDAASGTLNWSSPEATKDADVVKVPLSISNSANVYAVQLSGKVDANAFSIDGVNASLPEGWEMQWNVVDNELRVAMAGVTPLPSGSVAAIMVRMKSRESRLSFSTDAMLNESQQSLGAVEIAAVPTVFALAQNYPNPFNPSTTIKYQIANDANVNLDVYNLQGQKIRTLIAKEQKAGYYSVVWDGRNEAGQTVSSGLYLYRVQAGSFVATHKMLMIK